MGSDGVHDQALEEGVIGMKRADTQVSSKLMRHYRFFDQANATNRRIGQHSSESSPGELFSSILVWMKWGHKGNVLGEPQAKHIVLSVVDTRLSSPLSLPSFLHVCNAVNWVTSCQGSIAFSISGQMSVSSATVVGLVGLRT